MKKYSQEQLERDCRFSALPEDVNQCVKSILVLWKRDNLIKQEEFLRKNKATGTWHIMAVHKTHGPIEIAKWNFINGIAMNGSVDVYIMPEGYDNIKGEDIKEMISRFSQTKHNPDVQGKPKNHKPK